MEKRKLRLRTYNDDHRTAYLELLDHPHQLVPGCAKRTVDIHNLIPDYEGPGLFIDFDEQGRAIGIEILYSLCSDDDALDPGDDSE